RSTIRSRGSRQSWRCARYRRRSRPPETRREAQPRDLPEHRAVLLGEAAGGVGEVVALAHRAHLGSDLRVAIAGQVGETVVLDLEAEVAAHEMEQTATLDVGRAEHLAHVPAAARLTRDLLLGEGLGAIGEVPAEDDRVGPHVADKIGCYVAEQN